MIALVCRACGAPARTLRACPECGELDAYVPSSPDALNPAERGRLAQRVERIEANA